MRYLFFPAILSYLLLFFGSIYGLFVSDLSFKIGSNTDFHYSISGWQKNVLCCGGLLIVALIAVIPVVVMINNALKKAQ